MLKSLATIIFEIPLYQVENEIYFSLDGIFTSSHRANLSIDIIGNLLFINRNLDLWNPTPKKTLDIFSASIEPLKDIF